MDSIFARKALLAKGWCHNVRIHIKAGCIRDIDEGVTAETTDTVTGIIIPGLCNAHSHAFQRALAGRTEQRAPAGKDNFWSWRERMYELAAIVDAQSFAAIAAQAYTEMLEHGYTAVVEFHYLHRDTRGQFNDDMFEALAGAAAQSGIRLTYVPVLYERGGFDQPEPTARQRRFALDVDSFLEHHARASGAVSEHLNVGIGAHSLRAVSADSLHDIAEVTHRDNIPLHLHIAEQQGEVEQCVAATGQRPVRWLLENYSVDSQWCLVHATHMEDDEVEALAKTQAVVCLCPSTEANLGDGLFALREFLAHDGCIAIGSDSQVALNPFEELRWLEYGQRLSTQSRNVVSLQQTHVGSELFHRALQGGARASGQLSAGLRAGAAADLVTLDDDDPMFAGHEASTLLDALIFCGYRVPVERVMVHGKWQVRDAAHVQQDTTRAGYAAALASIGGSQAGDAP